MNTTLLDLYDRVRDWERGVTALREATDALIRISQMGGEAGVEADIAVNRMGTALKGYALVPDNEETRREQREDSFLPLRAVPDAALREFAEQPLGVAELMDDAAFERAVGEGRR